MPMFHCKLLKNHQNINKNLKEELLKLTAIDPMDRSDIESSIDRIKKINLAADKYEIDVQSTEIPLLDKRKVDEFEKSLRVLLDSFIS